MKERLADYVLFSASLVPYSAMMVFLFTALICLFCAQN
jgi:hypothetical protein